MSAWCIVRLFPDQNYGEDGDEVADVIGPFAGKGTAESLAESLNNGTSDYERFDVVELLAPSGLPTILGRLRG